VQEDQDPGAREDRELEVGDPRQGAEGRQHEGRVQEDAQGRRPGRCGAGEGGVCQHEPGGSQEDEVVHVLVRVHEGRCDQERREAEGEWESRAPDLVRQHEGDESGGRPGGLRERPGDEKVEEGPQAVHLVELEAERRREPSEAREHRCVRQGRLAPRLESAPGELCDPRHDRSGHDPSLARREQHEPRAEGELRLVGEAAEGEPGREAALPAQREPGPREARERERGGLAVADQAEERWVGDRENRHGPGVRREVRAGAPRRGDAERVEEGARDDPDGERGPVREARERREEERDLRPVDGEEGRALRLGHAALGQGDVGGVVVERLRAPVAGQGPEHVELEEVGSLEEPAPVAQARGREPGREDAPEAEREEQRVSAQALGSHPGVDARAVRPGGRRVHRGPLGPSSRRLEWARRVARGAASTSGGRQGREAAG